MCILLQSVLLSGFQKQASLVFENQAPAFRLRDCLWLYELIHAWGLLFAFRYYSAYNVYYVKFTRTFKRHVKAAGFVYVKKLLAHKFDPFPAVTLREFC